MRMRVIYTLLLGALVATFTGCKTSKLDLGKGKGVVALPHPNMTYAIGQIVEAHTGPDQVSIAFDPQIPADQILIAEGWSDSTFSEKQITSAIRLKIRKALAASMGSKQKIDLSLSKVKTQRVPKVDIYLALKKSITDDLELNEALRGSTDEGTRLDVVTQILIGKVTFKVIGPDKQGVDLDTDALDKINAEFSGIFSRTSSSDPSFSGADLVIGIHYAPAMIDHILR